VSAHRNCIQDAVSFASGKFHSIRSANFVGRDQCPLLGARAEDVCSFGGFRDLYKLIWQRLGLLDERVNDRLHVLNQNLCHSPLSGWNFRNKGLFVPLTCFSRDSLWMSQEPTAVHPVKSLRCVMCGNSAKIEVASKFECSNCGQVNQIGVAIDRVKGPIVWLAGDSKIAGLIS
jgi:predicted RNA-binding Zn-ribbon protein involved in translation (DUF1610 family)